MGGGQSNENWTSATKWQWNLFYSKVIARIVNIFIPLGDDVGRWWIHNLTHSCTFSSEWNRRPWISYFRSPKMWKSQRERSGLYEGCFPAKSLKLIPQQIGNMGTGVIMQKDFLVRQHSRVFWLYGALQHTQPLRNEQDLSALLCLPPFPILDRYTLHYSHLKTNKNNCAFSQRERHRHTRIHFF